MDLAEVNGITIVLRAVEVEADGVLVRLGAGRSARMAELDSAFETALQAWKHVAVTARDRGERPPEPPLQPGPC